jgi:hypothetical protein
VPRLRQAAGVPTREAELSDRYILKGHKPVKCDDLMGWAWWFEKADRQVRDTMQGEVRVSTVFLGIDSSLFGHGPPILFETLVFVNGADAGGERYATWDEAEAGHQRWVKQVFKPTPILTLPTTGDEHG